jgi:hypothetical protein
MTGILALSMQDFQGYAYMIFVLMSANFTYNQKKLMFGIGQPVHTQID